MGIEAGVTVSHVAVKVLRPGAAEAGRADFLGEIEWVLLGTGLTAG